MSSNVSSATAGAGAPSVYVAAMPCARGAAEVNILSKPLPTGAARRRGAVHDSRGDQLSTRDEDIEIRDQRDKLVLLQPPADRVGGILETCFGQQLEGCGSRSPNGTVVMGTR